MILSVSSYSKFVVSAIAVLIFLLGSIFITAYPRNQSTSHENVDRFVLNKIDEWKTKYTSDKGLKVARIDIHFRANPENFVKGEGAVIAPIGLDLPGFQKIVEVASYPPAIRELPVDGIKALAWPYTGKCRDDYHYVALTLVRQTQKDPIEPTQNPSFLTLPQSFVADAKATVNDLEEHNLHECSVFSEWARDVAGSGSYIEQFKRIVDEVVRNIIEEENKSKKNDDICAAIRHNQFSDHRAHVVTVMACRELEIPCYAFSAALENANHIVGTFSDQTGWIFCDLDNPEKGFFTEAPVLLTLAPLISGFDGSRHNYWYPEAAAYHSSGWGINCFSYTKWGDEKIESDVTITRTFNLDSVEK
jgi:hypothetical protein